MAYQIKYTSNLTTYSSVQVTAGNSSSGNAPGGNAPAPGGNAPTILPPPGATAISTNITHTVALAEANWDYFGNKTSTFSRMRVTIHNTGAWPNSPYSDNHVIIPLILDAGGVIQVNMRTDHGDRRASLTESEWTISIRIRRSNVLITTSVRRCRSVLCIGRSGMIGSSTSISSRLAALDAISGTTRSCVKWQTIRIDSPCILWYRLMLGVSLGSGILVLARRERTILSSKESFRAMRIGGTIGLPQARGRLGQVDLRFFFFHIGYLVSFFKPCPHWLLVPVCFSLA